MNRFAKTITAITGALLAVTSLAGCNPSSQDEVVIRIPVPSVNVPSLPSMPTTSEKPVNASQSASEALTALEDIKVDKTPSTEKYSREDHFGTPWMDMDVNHCDTRNDILARDLTNVVGSDDNCTVYSGTLDDPYTGKTINFVKGKVSSRAVQIDHIVPLHYAWTSGANEWDEQTRYEFANDPENLLAVDGAANGSKSDSGPSKWMPSNAPYQCEYAVKWVNVLDKYDLQIKVQDKIVLQKTLEGC